MNQAIGKVPPVLLLIMLITFPQISETIYAPALPNIAKALNVGNHLVEFTLSIYFIGFAIGMATWGNLSDYIGRRPAMLYGLIVYIIGSYLCYKASDINWLFRGRLIQALGASVGSIVVQTMVRDVFKGTKRTQVFSLFGMAIGTAPAFGPIIGGYTTQFFNWQAIFTLLLIMSLTLYFYAFFRLPETRADIYQQIDKTSILNVAKQMFSSKRVLGFIIIIGCLNGMLFSFYAEGPFIFINYLRLTPGEYGWLGMIVAASTVTGSLLSHRITIIMNYRQVIITGGILTLIGNVTLYFVGTNNLITPDLDPIKLFIIMSPIFVTFVGFGVSIPSCFSSALEEYDSVLGRAGSILGFSYYLVTAGVIAIMSYLHDGTVMALPSYFILLSITILLTYILTIHYEKN